MNAKLEAKSDKSAFYNELGWEVVDLLADELIEIKKELYERKKGEIK